MNPEKNFPLIAIEKFEEFADHLSCLHFYDKKSGLRGVVAIHNTNLGPAIGGTRYWRYDKPEDGLRDALRLSRAMTYKCALAGVAHGGGKGVIFADEQGKKSPELLRAYAQKINLLAGNFFTGSDVGIGEEEVKLMADTSPFIIGRKGGAGDPSPWAARGVFRAIESAMMNYFDSDSFQKRTITIKGLGKVGAELARMVLVAGGRVIAADNDPETVAQIQKELPHITFVTPAEIARVPSDVYSPCALGGEFDEESASKVQSKIVCGAANNQLTSPVVAERFSERGILYIPDYIANAGGLLNVAAELMPGGYKDENVRAKLKNIGETVTEVIDRSRASGRNTTQVADALAESIFMRTAIATE